jgi:ABC-type phosphate transport system substrate-binding protein
MKTTRLRRHRWRVLFAAGVVAVPVLVAGQTAGAATNATAVTPSVVLGSGSDVAYPVMLALDQLYNASPGCTVIAPTGTQPLNNECIPQSTDIKTENYDHDRISETYPIGGSSGITQLCEQGLTGVATTNFVRQTSAPSSTVCTGLDYVAYARDGITWEAFPKATGAGTKTFKNTSGACAGSTGLCLTQAQLQGIYVNCTITNWNQVGGGNVPIVRYSILPQYGTRKAFDTFLGGSSTSCAGTKLIDQTDNAEVAAADVPGAIVPVSVGSWNERYGKSTAVTAGALGEIDGVAPSVANLQNGTFPFGRFLYNVYCNATTCGTAKKASTATSKYLGPGGWICKATAHAVDPVTGVNYRTEINNTILAEGFAPLPSGPVGGGSTLTDYCRLFTS